MKGIAHKRIEVVLILAILACGSQSLAMQGLKDPLLKSRGGGVDIEMAVIGGNLPVHDAGPAPVKPQEIVAAINESGEGSAEYDPEDQSITMQPKPGFCARHCTCLKPFFEAIRQRWAMLPTGIKDGIEIGVPFIGSVVTNIIIFNTGTGEGFPLSLALIGGSYVSEVCQPYSALIKIPVALVIGMADFVANKFGWYGATLPYGLCWLFMLSFVGWACVNAIKDPDGRDAQDIRTFNRLPVSVRQEEKNNLVAAARSAFDRYRREHFGSDEAV